MAEDRYELDLHEASFGDEVLDVVSVSTDMGRAVAYYKYPRRDGADTDDMGGEVRVARCRILFFPRGPDDDYLGRLQTLIVMKDSAESWPFVDPIFGSFEARIHDFSVDVGAEPRDAITVTCSFVEATTETAIFLPGPGSAITAGPDQVKASAAELAAACAKAGVTTTVGTEASTAADQWADAGAKGEADARAINLELVSISNKIGAEVDRLQAATNIRRWPIFQGLTLLNYNLRLAAETVTSTTPRLVEVTVGEAVPLLALCARVYGAREALTRYEQVLRLNDVRNPARIEAGTVLKAQAAGGARRRLRSPR